MSSPQRPPHNRLGLDYRNVPDSRIAGPIVDIHNHVLHADDWPGFWEAAQAYGVTHVVTMAPLAQVDALRKAAGAHLDFIAVPNWRAAEKLAFEEFLPQWRADVTAFRERGARLNKFWMAPRIRDRGGLSLHDARLRALVDHTIELGYEFMVHIGDPTVWWQPGKPYADTAKYGTKAEQYEQLEWFLEYVAPRRVIGAHLGGNSEDPAFLARLLDRHQNYYLDTSATKWVVREVSRHPDAIRDLIVRFADRVLFGSDLVTDRTKYDFDHYASRYWAHRMLWETDHRGESPIEDPDADDPPKLNGVNLPADVLGKIYRENAAKFGYVSS